MGDFSRQTRRPRSRTVREDWFAWLPEEMDQLFGATRSELEMLERNLECCRWTKRWPFCEQEQFTVAKERVTAFAGCLTFGRCVSGLL